MNRFELRRMLYGEPITAQVLQLDEGVHVSLFGGRKPHIGAVSIADPLGACSTVRFPGHRDDAVSARWAAALSDAGYRPAVVEAGIHYDNLSRDGIAGVLAVTEEMLTEVLSRLSDTQ